MKRQIRCLNILVTNQCPLRCEHCGPRSGPENEGALALPKIIEALDDARSWSCQVVNFSGGEPFMLGPRLIEMVQAAHERGLLPRITTGAYWSNSAAAAGRRLDPLCSAGLRQLMISCSDSHRAFVPIKNVVEAAVAAQSRGLEVYLVLGTSKTSATTSRSVREAFEAAGVSTPWIIDSPLIPFGRAETWLSLDEMNLQPVERFAGPCTSLTQHPSIRADGQITGCGVVFGQECAPLSYGNIKNDSLGSALERMNNDPLAAWIHKVGVVELKQLIERNSSIRFADRYVNICHLCGDILKNPEALALIRAIGLAAESTATS